MSQISETCLFTPLHAGDAVGSEVGAGVGAEVVGAGREQALQESGHR